MSLPLHLFRLQPAPSHRDSEVIHIVTRADDGELHGPIFRSPALPTLHQLHNELPFSINFRAKKRRQR